MRKKDYFANFILNIWIQHVAVLVFPAPIAPTELLHKDEGRGCYIISRIRLEHAKHIKTQNYHPGDGSSDRFVQEALKRAFLRIE